MNQQQQNHRLRTDSSLSHQGAYIHFTGTRGLTYISLVPTFAYDSVVVKAQKLFSSHEGFLAIAMYHHRETIHYDETKKRAHDSQIISPS